MTYRNEHARKAMTAIAAVLAFSSIPAVAQDTGVTTDPVADTTVQTPTEVAPTTDAPAPAAETAAPPASTPKVEASRPATRTVKRTTTTTTTTRRASAPASAPAPAPAEPAAETAPIAPLAPEPVAEAAPPVAETPAPVADSSIDADEALPIAGAAALGLLALGGAGMAMRRRRRRIEAEEYEARQQVLDSAEAEPDAVPAAAALAPAPAFARKAAPIHDPVPDKRPVAGAPVTKLPNGFDLSRFGPHVQAAYRGPTEDNPSLSLKNRLRRASAMDQRERLEGTQAPARPSENPDRGRWNVSSDGNFMLRRERAAPEPVNQA